MIDIDLKDPETISSWEAVGELSQRLPGEWVLIGGLMVQLLAIEHGASLRQKTSTLSGAVLARARGAPWMRCAWALPAQPWWG